MLWFRSGALSTAVATLGIVAASVSVTACAETPHANAEPRSAADAAHATGAAAADSAEVARLVKQLGDREIQKAWTARDRLRAIGPGAMPALTAALSHDDPQVVSFAAAAMKGFGDAVSPAVPALLPALTRLRGRQEAEAVRAALREVGPSAAPHMPIMVAYAEALAADPAHQNPWFAHGSDLSALTTAFGGVGPEARTAVPFLLRAWQAHRRSPGGGKTAIHALAATQDPRALAALDSALRATSEFATVDPEDEQNLIGKALARFGEPGAAHLDRAYAMDNIPVRVAAVYGYTELGDAGVRRLQRVLEDRRPCDVEGYPELHWLIALNSLRERQRLPAALLPALRGVIRDAKGVGAADVARELVARLQQS